MEKKNKLSRETCKLSNPKDRIGIEKSPITYVPMPFIASVGLSMLEGGCKYRAHNYRVAGVRLSVYINAIWRHLAALWEGEWIDPDSGEPHISKVAACCAVVYDAAYRDKMIDDRPPKTKDGWIKEFNDKTKEMLKRYPNPRKPYTEKNLYDKKEK